MESAHIYSPTLHGRHWLFFFFRPSIFSPSLQAVNPYKGTSAGPVNHTEVLEMNKSSRDKDSTYLLSACCICCEMESGESLPKNKNAEKWEMNLVWECSYVHRLQIPSRAHCSCLGQSYSLCLCPSACFSLSLLHYLSRPQPTERGKWWTAEEDNWQQGPATSSKLSGGTLKYIHAHHVWIPALGGPCLAQRKGIL